MICGLAPCADAGADAGANAGADAGADASPPATSMGRDKTIVHDTHSMHDNTTDKLVMSISWQPRNHIDGG